MKKWQPLTVTFLGPELSESGTPNPFSDFRLEVTFQHRDEKFIVPGLGLAGLTCVTDPLGFRHCLKSEPTHHSRDYWRLRDD